MAKAAIIDSDAVARSIASDALADIGFDCDEYDSAESFSAASTAYDAYIVEMMLPEIDGVQLCQKIRATSDAPIVAHTVCSGIEWKAAAYFAGADYYVCKSASNSELKLAVLSVIRRTGIE